MSVSLVKVPDWHARAAELGRQAGTAAASWYFDGNTDRATYRKVWQGLLVGDSLVLDTFTVPDLSGEWAGSETPQSLAAELGIGHDGQMMVDDVDVACELWESAAGEAYEAEIARACRVQLGYV